MLVAIYCLAALYLFALMAVRGLEDDRNRAIALHRIVLDQGLSRQPRVTRGWVLVDVSDLDTISAANAAKVVA
jgi:hypothetical protein